jgi:hypothetical protein
MMKLAALMLATAIPVTAHASEPDWNEIKRYEIAFQALNAADAAQTCDFLARGRAYEMNPILGRHPSCPKVIAFKIAGGAVHYVLMRAIFKNDPRAARWAEIVTIAIQGGVVAANLRFTF